MSWAIKAFMKLVDQFGWDGGQRKPYMLCCHGGFLKVSNVADHFALVAVE